MTVPISTYRLQIRADFDLDAAAGIVDYLHDLGADWIYLSPILAATSGSDHGYDVVDHGSIDTSRGGPDALVRLARAVHARGMGIIVDIVPNHMGIASPVENAWWWQLLRDGAGSRYAEAFDVDWEAGNGRVLVPILSDESVVTVVDAEPGGAQLDVSGLRLPLRDGTDPTGPIEDVLAHQHYELIHWSRADTELNYRRFFSVTTLAGVRVEVPWVFEESHREIRRWFEEGLVGGLRVDHPDGLLDPGAYLDDLASATGDAFVLVEKILAGDEELPPHWPAAGTTGYDALAELDRVLVDPAGRGRLVELEAKLAGGEREPWTELTHRTRRRVADEVLRAEILRIARALDDSPQSEQAQSDQAEIADAIAEITACLPVYRSYLPYGQAHLEQAVAEATARRPELAACLERILPTLADPGHPAAQRLQQTTGMVMAKGVEDNAFYRFGGLVSLTEVGGDPSEFAIDVAAFHDRQARRQAAFPASLTALTTHDTKRSEDVRARVNVLSEVADEWAEFLAEVRRIVPLGSGDADQGALENVLWETIIGTWPASRERLHAYAEKAAREAGTSTTWTQPNELFERRVQRLVDAAFDNPEIAGLVAALSDRITPHGWSNSLAAKLIQLTSPGVPDVYQGTELWDRSLVDPDNRRAVDFDTRRVMLAELESGVLPPIDEDGRAKLLVTSRALRLRRDRHELFTRYLGLTALGESAHHVIAFDRGGAVTVAARLPVSLVAAGGWGDTRILVPNRDMVDVITGTRFDGGAIELAALLARYPVALLAPVE